MRSHIQFGSTRIDYHLEFSERKTLGITVTSELNVLVRAPFDASPDKVLEKLRKRAPWIIKQRSFFLSFQPKTPPRKFVSGETHLYAGKQYRLKIEESDIESVKLTGSFIVVATWDTSRAKQLVGDWYLRNAKAKLRKAAEPLIERFKRHNVEPTELVFRDMATRWGSCTAKGKIILNPELIKAPKGCIEYVIVHELLHYTVPNHGKLWKSLMRAYLGDYERIEDRLRDAAGEARAALTA